MRIKVYTRREFLKAVGLTAAAVVIGCRSGFTPTEKSAQATPPCTFHGPIKGRVLVGSKSRAGIAVSDGFDIVLTDNKGKYVLPNKNRDAVFVFVVQPNDTAKNSKSFCKMVFQLKAKGERIDFELLPAAPTQSLTKTRFVQITDIHTTDIARGQLQQKATEDILQLVPPADFIIATGDLVDHWGQAEEFSNYLEPVIKSPVPHFNVIGNHDVSKEANSPENYHRSVGPDYYSFDQGGVHFVVVNSVTPSDRQTAWFEKDLAMLGKGKHVVIFQHYPPTSEEMRKFDKLNVHSVFTGHWHSERVVKSAKTISITTPSFDMAGIDFSPAGFKIVDMAADGTMRTQYRPIGVSKWAKVVWPTGTLCKGFSEIIANIYDSSVDAKKINFKLHRNGQLKASGELKQQSLLNWTALLPDSIEAGDAEIEIQVDGKQDWAAKSNFTISDCAAPAIAPAGDWPMFMGNPARTGIVGWGLNPANLLFAPVWSVNTEGDIDLSSPILAGGKLFVTAKRRQTDAFTGCLAIEPATGKILWRFATEQSINHSPAYEAGVICIVEVGGRVYGIDAQTGKEFWRHDLGDNIGRWIYGAPAADEGRFYVGSVNRFARIDAKTGKVEWEKRLADDEPVEKVGFPNDWICTPVSPAISGKYLAMGGFWTGNDNLFVMDKTTGDKIWSHQADRGMHSSPAIAGDKILFFGKTSLLHCCNLTDGKLIWTKQLGAGLPPGASSWPSIGAGWSAMTPTVKNNVVIAGSGDGLMAALKLSDGSQVWEHKSGLSIFKISPYRTDNVSVLSSPTIAGETVFFGSADGKIYCLDFATGREIWSFDFGVPVLSTPLISGNAIFVAAYDGRVYAFSSMQKKNEMAFLTGRNGNENCNWQRPCRFYLQRGYQRIFDRPGSYC